MVKFKFTLRLRLDQGLTLIEVLIALAIIAIGFAALLRASQSSILITQRLNNKNLMHIVSLQAMHMIQSHLIELPPQKTATEKTVLFNQTWYWQAQRTPLNAMPSIGHIHVRVGLKPQGPFSEDLDGFIYAPP